MAHPIPTSNTDRTRAPSRPTTKISWTIINFWLDGALFLAFLALSWVTIVVRYIFPPATTAKGWQLWGWSLDQWIGCQFVLLAIFSLGVLIHVMLHWSWVCGVFYSKVRWSKPGCAMPDDGTRTIYGVGLLILILNLLGLLLAVAALSIRSPL
jgi:hypothetical protein